MCGILVGFKWRSSGRIFQHCPVLSSVFYILHLHAVSFQEIGDVAKPMLSHINKSFIKMKASGLLWLVKCHLSNYGITCSLVNFWAHLDNRPIIVVYNYHLCFVKPECIKNCTFLFLMEFQACHSKLAIKLKFHAKCSTFLINKKLWSFLLSNATILLVIHNFLRWMKLLNLKQRWTKNPWLQLYLHWWCNYLHLLVNRLVP